MAAASGLRTEVGWQSVGPGQGARPETGVRRWAAPAIGAVTGSPSAATDNGRPWRSEAWVTEVRYEPAEPAQVESAGTDWEWMAALIGALLLAGAVLLPRIFQGVARASIHTTGAAAEADPERRCRQLLAASTQMLAKAEAAVLDMDEALPLRALLASELGQIRARMSATASFDQVGKDVPAIRQSPEHWKALGRALYRCLGDLKRISDLAEAARASFGGATAEPRIPRTLAEAYFVLGANGHVDLPTLQRLVKALRQCWHPDLAEVEADRCYREARLKQINVAFELISGKRAAG